MNSPHKLSDPLHETDGSRNGTDEPKPLRVLIVCPVKTVAPHFETELEIAQRHLDRNDQVEFLDCVGDLACCDFNAERRAETCQACIGRRRMGQQLLSRAVSALPIVDRNEELPRIPRFKTLREIQEVRVDLFDIGAAVVSSLVSMLRDPDPDLERHRQLMERLWRAALQTYRTVAARLAESRPDRVYVFNGRFAATRAVLRACQSAGIECWIHERGCDSQHFQTFVNHLPHDIEHMQGRMRDAWNAAGPESSRYAIGASWFTDRIQRVERSWHSFVKDQTPGTLPANWDPRCRNIALFTSSEDEFASIGAAWRNRLYDNQTSALRRIIADFPRLGHDVRLYVRLHPNLKGLDNPTAQAQRKLCGPQTTVIAPEDPLDSYELLRQCDAAVTFGSSVGIEAVFWDRPSILLGPCFYRGFRAIHEPESHDQAMALMGSTLAPAADKSEALMYGFWFQTHGIRFRYFEASGLFEGKFRGEVVYDRPSPRRSGLRKRLAQWLRPAAA